MRARLAVLLALAGLLLAAPPAARAADRAQPGMWEVSVTVEVPGMAMSLPPTVQTQCMTQADVDADPVPALDKGACRATDIRRSGNQVTWKLTCSGQVSGRGEGRIDYRSPTAYDGWMTLETSGATVKSRIQARRVGDCQAAHADPRS